MRKTEKNSIIEINEEVQINDEVILEKGDRIEIVREAISYYINPKAIDMIKEDITAQIRELGHDPYEVGEKIGGVFYDIIWELNQEGIFTQPNGISKFKNGIKNKL